jgi:hypothetical protein
MGSAAAATGDNLRSLIFTVEDGIASLSVLDQLLLPHETKYVPVKNVQDAWDAVRSAYCQATLPILSLFKSPNNSTPYPLTKYVGYEYFPLDYAYCRSAPCAFVVLH